MEDELQDGQGRSSGETASRFSGRTRVVDVLAADPDAIDRLVSLHPLFQRLRDVEIRRSIGDLVTLAEAAEIVGVPLSDVLLAANARSPAACWGAYRDAPEEERPQWMDRFDGQAVRCIDVHPLIGQGREPFSHVLTCAAAISDGSGFVLQVPFNPLPLREVLGRKGFVSFAEREAADRWRIFFLRKPGEREPAAARSNEGATIWHAADGTHIDVRDLEAPAPLVAILALLDGPDHGGVVTVHHRREPVYLYPELAERGWTWERIPGEPGEVRLCLTLGAV